jgi:pimeloyl-ACP methyl ester carboxylesterase
LHVMEVPGAGHSVHHEQPAEVIAAVRSFLLQEGPALCPA